MQPHIVLAVSKMYNDIVRISDWTQQARPFVCKVPDQQVVQIPYQKINRRDECDSDQLADTPEREHRHPSTL